MGLKLALKGFCSAFFPRVVGVVKEAFSKVLWLSLFVIAIVIAVFSLPHVFSESPWAYALVYNTDSSRVQILPKPADCDWDYAPLGRKGCHYEKEVSVPRYSTDTNTGRPLVTYDDGKTWNWLPEGQKPGPAQVYVTWRKVQD